MTLYLGQFHLSGSSGHEQKIMSMSCLGGLPWTERKSCVYRACCDVVTYAEWCIFAIALYLCNCRRIMLSWTILLGSRCLSTLHSGCADSFTLFSVVLCICILISCLRVLRAESSLCGLTCDDWLCILFLLNGYIFCGFCFFSVCFFVEFPVKSTLFRA